MKIVSLLLQKGATFRAAAFAGFAFGLDYLEESEAALRQEVRTSIERLSVKNKNLEEIGALVRGKIGKICAERLSPDEEEKKPVPQVAAPAPIEQKKLQHWEQELGKCMALRGQPYLMEQLRLCIVNNVVNVTDLPDFIDAVMRKNLCTPAQLSSVLGQLHPHTRSHLRTMLLRKIRDPRDLDSIGLQLAA